MVSEVDRLPYITYQLFARRDVRAGRRSTVGNRVERVFVLEGSNPSLSAILVLCRFQML